ncbi:hypothetical protein [Thalassobacillus sp. CUG 92003]|nr:hypothetical protein [Thalassobacillus sp. CUG 92003]
MDWLLSWFAFAVAVGAYVEAAVRNKMLEKRIRVLEEYYEEEIN